MSSLLPILQTMRDLLLVVLGFSLIIVVHELGHFLVARWAGVRVLAFAVGFGPALVSYRKGMGIRRGSTEPEYNRRLKDDPTLARSLDISATEYRLNALPFGGYVKMLGQDDADPGSRSDEPDSFQQCPIWKRMGIISAGVVMNVILAAVLFIVVFSAGLKTEPPIVGTVVPGKPAAAAVPVNGPEAGVTEIGLKPGDVVVSLDGEQPVKFQDIVHAAAMSGRGEAVEMIIKRPGVDVPLRFEIVPDVDEFTRLQMIGISPLISNRVVVVKSHTERELFANQLKAAGVPEIEPGMTVVGVNGEPVTTLHAVTERVRASNGEPLTIEAETADGGTTSFTIRPKPELMATKLRVSGSSDELVTAEIDHLAGLAPVLRVVATSAAGEAAGLRPGDVFTLLGTIEWPSMVDGILQIRASKGQTIRAAVLRQNDAGEWTEVDLGDVPVSREGVIGFTAGTSLDVLPTVALWPRLPLADKSGALPSGSRLGLVPGSRIRAVDGHAINTLAEAREALIAAVGDARADGTIELSVQLPSLGGRKGDVETVTWQLPESEAADLAQLTWKNPLEEIPFDPETTLLKASGPINAIGMGLHETRSVMLTTYLTFARLFQGTVKVTHLKGPVGIAHVGTLLAGRGFIWLLFFMALISVNLAVINFLPIPITDGGHMIFLAYEQVTGRPVSPLIQNVATLASLLLLVSLFLVVTFNDLRALFTGG